MPAPDRLRALVLVLGDQLDHQSSAFDGFDPRTDAVWMAEVAGEATHVWSTQPRIAMFLAAMRHFAAELRARKIALHYRALRPVPPPDEPGGLAEALDTDLRTLAPERLVLTEPGEHRVLDAIQRVARRARVPLEVREDRHFMTSVRDFAAHAEGRKTLRLEYFYREQRRRHGILMEEDGEPSGGRWNFDEDNRQSFGRHGPQALPSPATFAPDAITREVQALVRTRFATHPGSLASFAWPVTREHALEALARFVRERLPHFGRHQDAMWTQEPWLYHSHLSAALNLKRLRPREVIEAAEQAYRSGAVPLASAEGFIRQILGWREYVRGIYWTQMPGYLERNALGAQAALPGWYWSGATDMTCLREAIGQTLAHGYAHHIQRLMVTGLYTLLLGVDPKQVHAWYLAVYVDAVEWVELPNTLGMSQYADGGLMASKPYIATGRYLERMSNYCSNCRFDPAKRTGPDACPFTTLYWDFIARHERRLAANPRTSLQAKQLGRVGAQERREIARRAQALREGALGGLE